MKYIIPLIIVTILLISTSCEDTVTPIPKAQKFNREELKNTVGYTWFHGYWSYYQTSDSLTQFIDSAFNPDLHKILIFMEPECSCKDLVKEPAYLTKVLDNSNISEANYELWGMPSLKSYHPYENLLHIQKLPYACLLRNDTLVYSILDSFEYHVVRIGTSLEKIVLNALETNQ